MKPFNSMIKKQIILNFLKGMSWLLLSNGFWRSIKVIPVSKHHQNLLKLSFKKEKHESVATFFLKPDSYSYKVLLKLKNSFVLARAALSKTLDNKGS